MSHGTIATILPLAAITATGMLAMDLYLPAVPAMQSGLALSVSQAQMTIAIFLVGLAVSQLVWGELLHWFGPKRCVAAGLGALVLASFGCAVAPDLSVLLVLRLIQGIAAGASTVVVPTVVRATLPEQDGVRGIAAISMIEAIIPAAGPVLGTALLLVVDWRATFAIIGAIGLIAAPFALRATPAALPGEQGPDRQGAVTAYRALLSNARFLRLSVSHALSFAALITFVASAPQVLPLLSGVGDAGFAIAQVCGVSGFIVAASQAGRVHRALGARAAIRLGAALHALLCVLLCAAWYGGVLHFAGLLVFWTGFCAVLGIRGPTAFSEALAVPAAQMGRASALMVLALLAVGGLAIQLTAPFLVTAGLGAVGVSMALLCLSSLALIARYPERPATAAAADATDSNEARGAA
ncbi:MFS transporter [Cupriavidus sp. AU9028]|uniref:MFS transporter n=1 Tax=Cupriavidus sp. AU9028 TaxID=2871157 RepID=UPI001C96527D|nr:MFS transporter [Cupriavidus sp. AU9028]MBY4896803.1 MFS transporter [Cupriavidus sp. AU9028]